VLAWRSAPEIARPERVLEAAIDPLGGAALVVAHLFGGHIAGRDDFDISDCAILPSGDVLLLERRTMGLRSHFNSVAKLQQLTNIVVVGQSLAYGMALLIVPSFLPIFLGKVVRRRGKSSRQHTQ
jgi:hypothetical protein